MLTRIEIDGFKTFEGFSMDLAPFLSILGPNASGKSNLFDAIRFLSQLATMTCARRSKDFGATRWSGRPNHPALDSPAFRKNLRVSGYCNCWCMLRSM